MKRPLSLLLAAMLVAGSLLIGGSAMAAIVNYDLGTLIAEGPSAWPGGVNAGSVVFDTGAGTATFPDFIARIDYGTPLSADLDLRFDATFDLSVQEDWLSFVSFRDQGPTNWWERSTSANNAYALFFKGMGGGQLGIQLLKRLDGSDRWLTAPAPVAAADDRAVSYRLICMNDADGVIVRLFADGIQIIDFRDDGVASGAVIADAGQFSALCHNQTGMVLGPCSRNYDQPVLNNVALSDLIAEGPAGWPGGMGAEQVIFDTVAKTLAFPQAGLLRADYGSDLPLDMDLRFDLSFDLTQDPAWLSFFSFRDQGPRNWWERSDPAGDSYAIYFAKASETAVNAQIVRKVGGVETWTAPATIADAHLNPHSYRIVCYNSASEGVVVQLYVDTLLLLEQKDPGNSIALAGQLSILKENGAQLTFGPFTDIQPPAEPTPSPSPTDVPDFSDLPIPAEYYDFGDMTKLGAENFVGVLIENAEFNADGVHFPSGPEVNVYNIVHIAFRPHANLPEDYVPTWEPFAAQDLDLRFDMEFSEYAEGYANWMAMLNFRDQSPGMNNWEGDRFGDKSCYTIQFWAQADGSALLVLGRNNAQGSTKYLEAGPVPNMSGEKHSYRLLVVDTDEGVAIQLFIDDPDTPVISYLDSSEKQIKVAAGVGLLVHGMGNIATTVTSFSATEAFGGDKAVLEAAATPTEPVNPPTADVGALAPIGLALLGAAAMILQRRRR